MVRKVKLHPKISAELNRWFGTAKRPLLEVAAAYHVRPAMSRWRIPFVNRPEQSADPKFFIRIRKSQNRIDEIEINPIEIQSRRGFSCYWRRLGLFVDLVSRSCVPEGEWIADMGDAIESEGPILGFCSNHKESRLVPDRGFYYSNGYRIDRVQIAQNIPFNQRHDAILWRGNPTGIGRLWTDEMDYADQRLNQRVRMCLLLKWANSQGLANIDARFVPNSEWSPDVLSRYRSAGIIGEYVSPESWKSNKFAIDIDGNSNAFSNLFMRLLYGCCVIKIDSPRGYRQWYYDRLRPWEHYIPVASDLTNLLEAIAWCRSHLKECWEIAAAGQSVVASMTREGEISRVAMQLQSPQLVETKIHKVSA